MSYLKALSNFRKQPYGLTLCPYCSGEGFRTGFKKALPQVVTAPHRLRGFSSPACNFHLKEYERNYLSPYVLSFTRGRHRFWCPITEIGFTAYQLKTTFCLFQRVRDRLYLTPPSLDKHTGSSSAYLGALGFMKSLERIVLRSIPLKSVLEWLAKPKGPNLAGATVCRAPEKALVLAATKRTLYMEDPPSMGVGLVYKPHYVSTESFCRAYMHLNVWHAAVSDKDSTDKLDSSHFILVSILEMSEVMPEALPHPLFLDIIDKEAV